MKLRYSDILELEGALASIAQIDTKGDWSKAVKVSRLIRKARPITEASEDVAFARQALARKYGKKKSNGEVEQTDKGIVIDPKKTDEFAAENRDLLRREVEIPDGIKFSAADFHGIPVLGAHLAAFGDLLDLEESEDGGEPAEPDQPE
jgi:hypothetical protein